MALDVHNIRELLSLARLLRHFALQYHYDINRELFLASALALEARARLLANSPDTDPQSLEHELVLHAPVDQLV